jgi:thymidine kinase
MIYFFYGSVKCGKSCTAYRLSQLLGTRICLPSIAKMNRARSGEWADPIVFENIDDVVEMIKPCSNSPNSPNSPNNIIIDEAQFLNPEWINLLASSNNTIICFGLLTDTTRTLFDGSRRLIEVSHSRELRPSTCGACGDRALFNARVVKRDDTCHMSGKQTRDIDGEYIPSCWSCLENERELPKHVPIQVVEDSSISSLIDEIGCGVQESQESQPEHLMVCNYPAGFGCVAGCPIAEMLGEVRNCTRAQRNSS